MNQSIHGTCRTGANANGTQALKCDLNGQLITSARGGGNFAATGVQQKYVNTGATKLLSLVAHCAATGWLIISSESTDSGNAANWVQIIPVQANTTVPYPYETETPGGLVIAFSSTNPVTTGYTAGGNNCKFNVRWE